SPPGLDQPEPPPLAEALPHDAAEIADSVDQAKLERAPAGEDLAAEEHALLAAELHVAAAANQLLETLMHVMLEREQPFDTLRVFREEGIEQRLVLAGCIKTTLNAEFAQGLGEAEAGADDADGSEERGLVGEDFIARKREPIAARSSYIFGEGDDGNTFLVGELTDAPVEQR